MAARRLDGQVKLFAAMLHEEKVVIAQHRIPDETTETTQVKELLETWTWTARWSPPTPSTRNGTPRTTSPGRKKTAAGTLRTSCSSRATSRNSSAPSSTPIQAGLPPRPRLHGTGLRPRPDHPPLPLGHQRRRRIDFPHVSQVARIRRDGYDASGALISKEIVHAVTSLDEDQASAADLAKLARGQWGIESVHWSATPPRRRRQYRICRERPPGHGHAAESLNLR